MKRFFVATPDDGVKYFICHGDEHKLCDGCVARFSCYTGELPYSFCAQARHNRHLYSTTVEDKLFGIVTRLVEYDYSILHICSP